MKSILLEKRPEKSGTEKSDTENLERSLYDCKGVKIGCLVNTTKLFNILFIY